MILLARIRDGKEAEIISVQCSLCCFCYKNKYLFIYINIHGIKDSDTECGCFISSDGGRVQAY